MHELIAVDLNPLDREAVVALQELEAGLAELPQVEIRTEHMLHAGMYARTVYMPAGSVVTGALMALDTILIIQGHCWLHNGQEATEIQGYQVLSGSAGRKSLCRTITDTVATMLFPTRATSVEDAEAEFTVEVNKLLSRKAIGVHK